MGKPRIKTSNPLAALDQWEVTDEFIARLENPSVWSSTLMCSYQAWRVIAEGELALDIPEGCCDMGGAIEIAQHIEPTVRRIVTYSAGKMDTIYVKSGGEWTAYDPPTPMEAEAQGEEGTSSMSLNSTFAAVEVLRLRAVLPPPVLAMLQRLPVPHQHYLRELEEEDWARYITGTYQTMMSLRRQKDEAA